MGAAFMVGLTFGLGVLLLLTGQPIGRARPSIASRLQALRPDRPPQTTSERVPAFRTRIFEEILRPLIERGGEALLLVARRLGLDLGETASRLMATGDPGGLGLFLGQKIATGLLGLAFLPAAAALGAFPHTPSWIWVATGLMGFLMPDAILRSKAEARRRELREGLARFADLVSLSVSAGLGLEGALEEVSRRSEGPFFEYLRRTLRETRLRGEPASTALTQLAQDLRLADAEPLASALASAQSHGIPVSQVLRAQARSIRERRRIELVEAGERAQTRMVLPVGLLILPAFFLLVLYPAAVQLLQVTAK